MLLVMLRVCLCVSCVCYVENFFWHSIIDKFLCVSPQLNSNSFKKQQQNRKKFTSKGVTFYTNSIVLRLQSNILVLWFNVSTTISFLILFIYRNFFLSSRTIHNALQHLLALRAENSKKFDCLPLWRTFSGQVDVYSLCLMYFCNYLPFVRRLIELHINFSTSFEEFSIIVMREHLFCFSIFFTQLNVKLNVKVGTQFSNLVANSPFLLQQ